MGSVSFYEEDTESIIQSERYSLTDAIVLETELTSAKTWNVALNDTDFYCEFTVNPPNQTSTYSYIQIGESTNNCYQIGQLFSNGNTGIRLKTNTSVRVYATIPVETDTLIKVTRIGSVFTVFVGETELTLTDDTISCDTLLNLTIANNIFKNFKIYPI